LNYTRRDVVKGVGAAVGVAFSIATSAASRTVGPKENEALTWLPAWKLRDLVVKGEISAVELVTHFLGRIEEFDRHLHSFKLVDHKGALEQARNADRARSAGQVLGPLHGVPISIKEHIPLAGFANTGMGVIDGPAAKHDYVAVERLKRAGAIIVGKNTMMLTGNGKMRAPDWEHEARNPWDLARVPGWSSSGCAAAAAARLVPIALGGDGGGSIRLPAAYTGLVGLHPTRGRIPHVGYTPPYLQLTTTVGPMCRSVRDAAIALGAMAGPDGRDFVCMQDDPPDYVAGLKLGVRKLSVVWTNDFGLQVPEFEESAEVIRTVRAAADRLNAVGIKIQTTGIAWESPGPHAAVTATVYDQGALGTGVNVRGGEVIPSSATLPATAAPSDEKYEAAIEVRRRNMERFRTVFAEANLIISPTVTQVAPTVEQWLDRRRLSGYTSLTSMFNWLGLPAISVPCGLVNGLPVGMHIAGPPGSEAAILRLAEVFSMHAETDFRPRIA